MLGTAEKMTLKTRLNKLERENKIDGDEKLTFKIIFNALHGESLLTEKQSRELTLSLNELEKVNG